MNNTIRRLAVLGLVSVVAFASCGSDDESVTEPAPTTTAAAAVATITTEEPTTTQAVATTDASADSSFSVYISEPAALDPALAAEVEGGQVIRLLFEPLVTLSPELEVVPGVAESWSVADDGLTWTFELGDSTFSDGAAVTADDFAYGFARAADPDLAAIASYQGLPIAGWKGVLSGDLSGAVGDTPVSGVTAVDADTLEIVTTEQFALLPKVLTYPIFAPVQASRLASADDARAWAEAPVGNGPYMMSGDWEHNVGITVERNPNWHRTPGSAEQIEFKIYADAATAYRDFEAGNLDIARTLPAEKVEDARKLGDRFKSTAIGSLFYIGFPTDRAPFDNPDVRTALALAIDREAIAERTFHGAYAPATGVVPPSVPGALTDQCAACTYDPERAKELLDAVGGIAGNTIVLYDIADDGQDAIQPIINSWHEVLGLDVEVRSFPFAQFLEETAAGKAEGPFELGWVWDYPSGYSILSPLFESTSGSNNLSWANNEFDALMKNVRVAADEASAFPTLQKAQKIAEAEVPLTPVLFQNDLGVHSERLSNVNVDAGMMWRLELIDVAA